MLNFYPRDAILARVLAVVVCLCVSVCLSLCLSHAGIVAKRLNGITQITPHDTAGTLVFWRQQSLVGDPHTPWNLRTKWPTPFWTQRFRLIPTYSSSTVRAGEKKLQLDVTESWPRTFQQAMGEPCTLPLSPTIGWHKTQFCCFCQ